MNNPAGEIVELEAVNAQSMVVRLSRIERAGKTYGEGETTFRVDVGDRNSASGTYRLNRRSESSHMADALWSFCEMLKKIMGVP